MYVDLEVMDRFEELECIISNASSIPFSHKSGIDKEEVLELINNILNILITPYHLFHFYLILKLIFPIIKERKLTLH